LFITPTPPAIVNICLVSYNIRMSKFIWESLIVGIILLIISIPIMEVVEKLPPGKTKYYLSTMAIGMFTHFIFKYGDIGKMYCGGSKNTEFTHPASW